ncbi:MAG: hypothetical protein MJ141_00255 [Clostridia bacterium]|nr:hypothetical protein [Clostridia bacterium]
MEKKRVLLIAGAGTLGSYTSQELLKMGYLVDVIALEKLVSYNANLTYICARVDDALLKELFAAQHYDAIVDFIHYSDTKAYQSRAKLLLENTDQLVFLSSYRIYANKEVPVRETSPRLIDVYDDPYMMENEGYGVPKAINEDFLRASGYKNWTIIRPLISFSHFRLDLVTLGAPYLLFRAKAGKKTLLPKDAKNMTAGVGWAGNIGKMIARLIGNEKAFGEAFTLGTGENLTWGEVADIYTEVTGLEFVWVDTKDYLENATANQYGNYCILNYDRLWDRKIDNSKLLNATGLTMKDFVGIKDALIYELGVLAENPELIKRFDTEESRMVNEKMDKYLASIGE